jgi:hypothetical protein
LHYFANAKAAPRINRHAPFLHPPPAESPSTKQSASIVPQLHVSRLAGISTPELYVFFNLCGFITAAKVSINPNQKYVWYGLHFALATFPSSV